MSERTLKTLANLANAVASLREFVKEPILTNRDQAGVVQGFEFCYELFWKAFKKIAEDQGGSVGLPKQAFAAALQVGLISPEEEQKWILIMKDRNLTSHVYNQDLAKAMVQRIVLDYLPLFESTLMRINQSIVKNQSPKTR